VARKVIQELLRFAFGLQFIAKCCGFNNANQPKAKGVPRTKWVRVIDGALQEWEAKNRQRTGRPQAKVGGATPDKCLYWRMVRLDEKLDPLIGSTAKLPGLGTNQYTKKDDGGCYDGNTHVRGNSEEYVVRRLKRDAPELAAAAIAAVKRGTML